MVVHITIERRLVVVCVDAIVVRWKFQAPFEFRPYLVPRAQQTEGTVGVLLLLLLLHNQQPIEGTFVAVPVI